MATFREDQPEQSGSQNLKLDRYQPGWAASARAVNSRLRKQQLKSLILAQNERWRRGLGMQVERFM
jgi:hypothetical protein